MGLDEGSRCVTCNVLIVSNLIFGLSKLGLAVAVLDLVEGSSKGMEQTANRISVGSCMILQSRDLRAEDRQNESSPRQITCAVLRICCLSLRYAGGVVGIAASVAVPRSRRSTIGSSEDRDSNESSDKCEI